MTEEFASLIKLDTQKIHAPVAGLNQTTTTIKQEVTTVVESRYGDFSEKIEFLIVPLITGPLPAQKIHISECKFPQNIQLADPDFNIPSNIDLLIGTEYFYSSLLSGSIKLEGSKLRLVETQLGWIVAGNVGSCSSSTHSMVSNCLFLQNHSYMNGLTSGQDVLLMKEPSEEALMFEKHFKTTHTRLDSGRYSLRLPFRQNMELGESKYIALNRFQRLQKQLDRNPDLKKSYHEFMDEYLKNGHMEEATDTQENAYFIPHHAVLKQDSTTTKLRVVFEASAKTSNGFSLNDFLMVGAQTQRDLFSIIIRFMRFRFVFTADLEKMFRQILIDSRDRIYLCIIWIDSQGRIKIFHLTTVTYGTACAAHQATRVLLQLALDEGHNFPKGVELLFDFFMDDVMSGGDDLEQLKEAMHELIEMLKSAGMNLRKFTANHSELLQGIQPANIEQLIDIGRHEKSVKTLGLVWNPTNDKFMFRIPETTHHTVWTKRLILSELNKLFDPIGWLSPVKVLGSQILQKLWIQQVSWDEAIPDDIANQWINLYSQLPVLNQIEKNRNIFQEKSNIQLHGFSDASSKAYGAAIYIRSVDNSGRIHVNLLCSKARIAPQPNKKRKKPITLPKLELCAANLLAKLSHKVLLELEVGFQSVDLWCDSTIVLNWIKKGPESFVPYVSRRVREIKQLTLGCTWNYIRSAQNPADIVSRGLMPKDIIQHQMWWHGSSLLFEDPVPKGPIPGSSSPPEFNISTMATVQVQPVFNIKNFSNYNRLVRSAAYVMRFINNCRLKIRDTSTLSLVEVCQAELLVIKEVQKEEFSQEIRDLQTHGQVSSKSKLISLSPFLDNEVLRVGGRLHNTGLTNDQKHQIILPSSHRFTRLLIEWFHKTNLHGGAQLVLSTIRQRFWILRGRSTVRDIIRKCVQCFRVKPKRIDQLMGTLPAERVQPNRPFAITGLDYAGPFLIQNKSPRPTALIKVYCCVFVCFATKAVHLEAVTDLTSAAFLKCLRRFRARRGKCTIINSDNASTFTGAKKEIENLQGFFMNSAVNDEIKELCTGLELTWKFIPVKSPSIGGLWESTVKSFKYHLKRIAPDTNFSLEEFITLLCEIEACLNSRPLTPLSEDPADMGVLTPGHFLIGEPLNAFVEPDIQEVPYNRLKRHERVQKMTQQFWQAWQRDYLNTLQQRNKWKLVKDDVKVGEMVLLIEENLPPTKWSMGRIIEVSRGNDGHVRVVTIQLPHRQTQRAISKICPLPIEYD